MGFAAPGTNREANPNLVIDCVYSYTKSLKLLKVMPKKVAVQLSKNKITGGIYL